MPPSIGTAPSSVPPGPPGSVGGSKLGSKGSVSVPIGLVSKPPLPTLEPPVLFEFGSKLLFNVLL